MSHQLIDVLYKLSHINIKVNDLADKLAEVSARLEAVDGIACAAFKYSGDNRSTQQEINTAQQEFNDVALVKLKEHRAMLDKLMRYDQKEIKEPIIKPCPFCGGEGVLAWSSEAMCWIECRHCDAEADYSTTEAQAIKIWNRRV